VGGGSVKGGFGGLAFSVKAFLASKPLAPDQVRMCVSVGGWCGGGGGVVRCGVELGGVWWCWWWGGVGGGHWWGGGRLWGPGTQHQGVPRQQAPRARPGS
jgi:hypothetical protein